MDQPPQSLDLKIIYIWGPVFPYVLYYIYFSYSIQFIYITVSISQNASWTQSFSDHLGAVEISCQLKVTV